MNTITIVIENNVNVFFHDGYVIEYNVKNIDCRKTANPIFAYKVFS